MDRDFIENNKKFIKDSLTDISEFLEAGDAFNNNLASVIESSNMFFSSMNKVLNGIQSFEDEVDPNVIDKFISSESKILKKTENFNLNVEEMLFKLKEKLVNWKVQFDILKKDFEKSNMPNIKKHDKYLKLYTYLEEKISKCSNSSRKGYENKMDKCLFKLQNVVKILSTHSKAYDEQMNSLKENMRNNILSCFSIIVMDQFKMIEAINNSTIKENLWNFKEKTKMVESTTNSSNGERNCTQDENSESDSEEDYEEEEDENNDNDDDEDDDDNVDSRSYYSEDDDDYDNGAANSRKHGKLNINQFGRNEEVEEPFTSKIYG